MGAHNFVDAMLPGDDRSSAAQENRQELGSLVPTKVTDRPAGPFTRGVDVTVAEPDDVDQLSRVIAVAFHDLNASHFLIPDDEDRRRIYPEFFKLAYLRPAVTNGVVHRSSDSLACAVWLPTGDVPADPDPETDAALEALTGTYFPNFAEFDRLLAQAHQPYMHIPHYFLGVVGAHPVVQRQGNLRSLMAAWLPELDRLGRGSYLEAAEPYLVPVYQRYGYQRTDQIIQLPNCQMFPMWRPPAGKH